MKALSLCTLLLGIGFSVPALSATVNPAVPTTNAVHPDLEVTPPADRDKVLQEIEAAIQDLREKAASDIEKLQVSIPDYRPANDKLQTAIVDALTQYLKSLIQIRDKMKMPLSQLAAIKAQADQDKSGFFTKLYNNELERIIPPLNSEINVAYQTAMQSLMTVNGTYRVPMRWKRVKSTDGNGLYELSDQVFKKFSGSTNCVGSYYQSHCYADTYEIDEPWLVTSPSSQGEKKMLEIEQSFTNNLFADCKTGACVLKLNEDVGEFLDIAEVFFQDIQITRPEFGEFRWGRRDPSPIVSESWLLAAKRLMEQGDENTRVTIAGSLEHALKGGGSIAVASFALPEFILEKSARFMEQLLSSSSVTVELKLKKPEAESFSDLKSRLGEIADEKARALPAVVYQN